MLKIYIYWHKCWCNGCGTDNQQVKIGLLSFWSVNCWVSQWQLQRWQIKWQLQQWQIKWQWQRWQIKWQLQRWQIQWQRYVLFNVVTWSTPGGATVLLVYQERDHDAAPAIMASRGFYLREISSINKWTLESVSIMMIDRSLMNRCRDDRLQHWCFHISQKRYKVKTCVCQAGRGAGGRHQVALLPGSFSSGWEEGKSWTWVQHSSNQRFKVLFTAPGPLTLVSSWAPGHHKAAIWHRPQAGLKLFWGHKTSLIYDSFHSVQKLKIRS